MADEKQMSAIRFFCRTSYLDHGVQRASKSGSVNMTGATWSSRFLTSTSATSRRTRQRLKPSLAFVLKEFPNGEDWMKITNAPGAHEKILSIIRNGLAAQLALKPEGSG